MVKTYIAKTKPTIFTVRLSSLVFVIIKIFRASIVCFAGLKNEKSHVDG